MSPTSKKGSFMNVEIAQRLAAMRREQGYSQEELAERLGLSRQAVSKWERAESSPDTGNLIALAKLYGVSLEFNGAFSCHAQKICRSSGKMVLKNSRFVPCSFSVAVT